MKISAVAVATLAHLPTALGWWDNGHMLVGQVATQLMAPADVTTINSVLEHWKDDFPNTNTITTTAIWPDLIKCKSKTATCQSPNSPSFSMMDTWHYMDLPAHVNGSKWKDQDPSLDLFKDNLDGLSYDFLEKAMTSFATTKSIWAANLLLRQFIHIFGDSHQPMHTVGGISDKLPGGDVGGNKYTFQSPCGFSNLHALWDAAGGEYSQNNWSPDTSAILPALEANATELIGWLPSLADPLNYEQYKDVSYADFQTAMVKNSGLRNMILDTFSYAQTVVYPTLDKNFNAAGNVPCPTKEYIDWTATVAKFRIAVGGKRLAVILTQFAKQIRTLKLAN
ncbi:hypothetical protein FI667_g10784, partial [Globisporangium splendens]